MIVGGGEREGDKAGNQLVREIVYCRFYYVRYQCYARININACL